MAIFNKEKIKKIGENYTVYTANAVLENHLYECESKLKFFLLEKTRKSFVEIVKEFGDIMVLCEVLIIKGINFEMGSCSYKPTYIKILGHLNFAKYLKNESKKDNSLKPHNEGKERSFEEFKYITTIKELYFVLMKFREENSTFKEIVDKRPERFLQKIEGDR